MKKLNSLPLVATAIIFASGLAGCHDDIRTDGYATWDEQELLPLSEEQKEVIAYMPKNVIIAHRGSEFWAPEESEAAMRWARNMGADYIECDLQMTADGVVLALHDESLLRTTNVETVYPNRKNDYTYTFTYDELLKLDIGSWFNEANPEQARESFRGLDILTLQDVLAIAEGKRIKRDADGKRIVNRDAEGNYVSTVYEPDPSDNGNRPGVYIETKSPFLFSGVEQRLHDILLEEGWYADDPADMKKIEYKDGKQGEVDIANTKARIILQTFENAGLKALVNAFPRRIPILYLYGDMAGTPESYAALINFAIENGATILGPNINYVTGFPSSINIWQLKMCRKSGMPIHAWSFNTNEQYLQYTGPWSDPLKTGDPDLNALDGSFTNLTDMALRFYKETLQGYADQGLNYFRSNASCGMPDNIHASKTMRDPNEVLDQLGY